MLFSIVMLKKKNNGHEEDIIVMKCNKNLFLLVDKIYMYKFSTSIHVLCIYIYNIDCLITYYQKHPATI